MKAIRYDRYGAPDVLELRDVDDPEPAGGEVRIRVHAASANPRDWHFLRGSPKLMRLQFGLRRPRDGRLGSDVAGVVDAVGAGVTRLRPGDEVYADTLTGAFAEQVCVPADLAARKPANLSFAEAAALPLAGLTALQAVRDRAALGPGRHVLIIGAGGGVGTIAVQLAHHLGAEVTGVCSSGKADLVRSLGADRVIDHTRSDIFDGTTYDVVLNLAGTRPPHVLRRALARDGLLLESSGESRGHLLGPLVRIGATAALSRVVPQTLSPLSARRSGDDLDTLRDLVEAGAVRPVLDRTYPLAEVPEAIRYLEEGHARGKVVVAVTPTGPRT
jgi:NADPH:quinone reductase-like Zn-dependent oxidoreductase